MCVRQYKVEVRLHSLARSNMSNAYYSQPHVCARCIICVCDNGPHYSTAQLYVLHAVVVIVASCTCVIHTLRITCVHRQRAHIDVHTREHTLPNSSPAWRALFSCRASALCSSWQRCLSEATRNALWCKRENSAPGWIRTTALRPGV